MSTKTAMDASTSNTEKDGIISRCPLRMWVLTVKATSVVLIDVLAEFDDLSFQSCRVRRHSQSRQRASRCGCRRRVVYRAGATDATIASLQGCYHVLRCSLPLLPPLACTAGLLAITNIRLSLTLHHWFQTAYWMSDILTANSQTGCVLSTRASGQYTHLAIANANSFLL